MDNRQLLIAGVVAPLVVLVTVLSVYLLVVVPGRDARRDAATVPPTNVRAERPPGAMDDGDGFRPSVVADEPPPDVTPAASDLAGDDLDGDGYVDEPAGLEAPPRRAPRPAPLPAPATRAEHEAFAQEYLARQMGTSVSDVVGLYATPVRYYALGRVDAQTVTDDKDAYFRRFPSRRYALAGPVRVASARGAATLRFDYTFAVGGGPGGERSGRATVELDVVPADGTFLIRGEQGHVY